MGSMYIKGEKFEDLQVTNLLHEGVYTLFG
jgi:hypothetical protein